MIQIVQVIQVIQDSQVAIVQTVQAIQVNQDSQVVIIQIVRAIQVVQVIQVVQAFQVVIIQIVQAIQVFHNTQVSLVDQDFHKGLVSLGNLNSQVNLDFHNFQVNRINQAGLLVLMVQLLTAPFQCHRHRPTAWCH
jgi:hypothetical protein